MFGLLAFVVLAFVLRVSVRVATGESEFLRHGYTLYLSLSRHFVDGAGLCLSSGAGCARRMPLYPLLMAPFLARDHLYPWLPVVQSAWGAVTVWVAWKIALELFGARAALVTAALTALNPYAVVHDTSLQETSLFNLLVAAAVFQLLRLRRCESRVAALGAGVMLGLAMLTTARIELFLLCAVVWAARVAGSTPRIRYRQASLVALPILILVGGWAGRNWTVVGSPVLTTETGKNLWVGNNEWTFSHFPEGSIDLSQAESFRNLSPGRRAALASLRGEVDQDKLEASWALEDAKAHPGLVAWGGVRKVWVALSAQLSPARGRALSGAYRAGFLVVHLLAAVGLLRLRGDRGARTLIVLLLASFAATTALFWSHTSHKSCLDVVLFACAASVIAPFIEHFLPSMSCRFLPTRPHRATVNPAISPAVESAAALNAEAAGGKVDRTTP